MKRISLAFFIGSLAIILSLLPFIVSLVLPIRPDRVNLHWDNWLYDFNYYLSVVRQGTNGRFTVIDKYTSENQSGKFLRIGYLALGHAAKTFHVSPTAAYHAARLILGIIFICSIYRFISIPFIQQKSLIPLIFFLALFTAGYPEIVCTPGCHPVPRLWSITQLDPIRRVTFMPHFLWGQIAYLVVLIIFISKKHSLFFLAVASIFLGVAGLDHPPSLLFIFPTLLLTLAFLLLKKELTKDELIKSSIVFIIALPFVYYLFSSTNVLPWSLTRNASYPLNTDFFSLCLALGPTFLIGSVYGLSQLFSKEKIPTGVLISVSWLLSLIVLTFGVRLPVFYSQTRFLQIDPRIPSAVLVGCFLSVIFKKISRLRPKKQFFLKIFLILVVFLPTVPTLYLLFYDQFDYAVYFSRNYLSTIPYPPYVDYPPKDWMRGFSWLKDNSRAEDIVVSDFTAGNFIPAYAGNTVYYGHTVETNNPQEKKENVVKFFSSDNIDEQKIFLLSNRIRYVFYGPQEKSYRAGGFQIPDLHAVYENPLITIYQFHPISSRR